MTIGSLFAGIGGVELGLEWSGLVHEVKWQVEIDPYCQKVLAKHWPETKRYGDIKEVGGHNLEPVDIICGGFPCQPYSVAGKRRGAEDDRALWPEMARVIEELRPSLVIGENVFNIVDMGIDDVCSDLERIGYSVASPLDISSAACYAQTVERHLWIIATTTGDGCKRSQAVKIQNEPRTQGKFQGSDTGSGDRWNLPASRLCGVGKRIPARVDRLKCLGNAVVPQVAEAIGTIIKEWIEANQ